MKPITDYAPAFEMGNTAKEPQISLLMNPTIILEPQHPLNNWDKKYLVVSLSNLQYNIL